MSIHTFELSNTLTSQGVYMISGLGNEGVNFRFIDRSSVGFYENYFDINNIALKDFTTNQRCLFFYNKGTATYLGRVMPSFRNNSLTTRFSRYVTPSKD